MDQVWFLFLNGLPAIGTIAVVGPHPRGRAAPSPRLSALATAVSRAAQRAAAPSAVSALPQEGRDKCTGEMP